MRVQDLQQFLSSFTEGSDAVKNAVIFVEKDGKLHEVCLLYTSPSPRDRQKSRMPSSA